VDAIQILDRLKLPLLAIHIRLFLAAALGGLGAWIFDSAACFGLDGPWGFLVGLVALPAVYLFYVILKWGAPVEFIIYGLFGLMVIWGFFVL
jgi:hypothetical protein